MHVKVLKGRKKGSEGDGERREGRRREMKKEESADGCPFPVYGWAQALLNLWKFSLLLSGFAVLVFLHCLS